MSIPDAINHLTLLKSDMLEKNRENTESVFNVLPLIQFCQTYDKFTQDDFTKMLKEEKNDNCEESGAYRAALDALEKAVATLSDETTKARLLHLIQQASLDTIDLNQTSDSAHKSHP